MITCCSRYVTASDVSFDVHIEGIEVIDRIPNYSTQVLPYYLKKDKGTDNYTEAYKTYYLHLKSILSASSCSSIMCAIRRCLLNDNVDITSLAFEQVKDVIST